jgi:hypothetical protein
MESEDHFHYQKILPLDAILSQRNPVHTLFSSKSIFRLSPTDATTACPYYPPPWYDNRNNVMENTNYEAHSAVFFALLIGTNILQHLGVNHPQSMFLS